LKYGEQLGVVLLHQVFHQSYSFVAGIEYSINPQNCSHQEIKRDDVIRSVFPFVLITPKTQQKKETALPEMRDLWAYLL
jgi:hypothetical protein